MRTLGTEKENNSPAFESRGSSIPGPPRGVPGGTLPGLPPASLLTGLAQPVSATRPDLAWELHPLTEKSLGLVSLATGPRDFYKIQWPKATMHLCASGPLHK